MRLVRTIPLLIFLSLPVASAVRADVLVVLNKSDHEAALVEPATLEVTAKLPTGRGPHEVAISRRQELQSVRRQIVRQVLHGKREAFSLLVERYQKPIFNFVYRFYGNHDLAQELTQETFLRCYQFLKSYDPERKFSTWLYTVAKNLCIDELKKQRTSREVPLDDAIVAVERREAEAKADRNQQVQCIRKEEDFRLLEALQELPPPARTVLLLHYFQGLSYQEIGEALSLPVSTVKIRIFRAKKSLLERWRELGGEGDDPVLEER